MKVFKFYCFVSILAIFVNTIGVPILHDFVPLELTNPFSALSSVWLMAAFPASILFAIFVKEKKLLLAPVSQVLYLILSIVVVSISDFNAEYTVLINRVFAAISGVVMILIITWVLKLMNALNTDNDSDLSEFDTKS